MPMAQRLATWIALVAMLVATPAAAYGRFECSLGMAQAGPACPVCHGEPGPPVDGPSFKGQCCKYVGAQVAPAEIGEPLPQPTRSPVSAPTFQAASAEGVSATLDSRLPLELILDRAPPSKPSPLYLSNFLRL